MKKAFVLVITAATAATVAVFTHHLLGDMKESAITRMVRDHARAWETGDEKLLSSLLHEDVVFAYPGRRLTKAQTLVDLRHLRNANTATKVYIRKVIVDGDDVAVEWQFATTTKATGKREAVSDAIIARVKDGKFVVWKEYLDGRVRGMQADGRLALEEGEDPFPWPREIHTTSPGRPKAPRDKTAPSCGSKGGAPEKELSMQ